MKDKVKCLDCGYEGGNLVKHILNQHDFTIKEYLEKYPEAEIFSEKMREDISQSVRKGIENGKIPYAPSKNPEVADKIRKALKGRTVPRDVVEKVLKTKRIAREKAKREGRTYGVIPPEATEKMIRTKRTKKFRAKAKKISEGLWEKEDYRRKTIRGIIKARGWLKALKGRKPTSPERILISISNTFHLPIKYVGNGRFYIGTKNPDFIDTLGLNKVVEVFGDYWHRGQDPKDRIEVFRKLGHSCMVIWEHELKSHPAKEIANRVSKFLGVL